MKYAILILCFVLPGCDLGRWAIVTKDGVLYNNIKNKETCYMLVAKLHIDGICIPQ